MNTYVPHMAKKFIAVIMTFAAVTIPALASDDGHEGEHEGVHHKQTIALFAGATRAHGENESTLGVEAGFIINKNWGAGVLFERAERDIDTTLILVGAEWHPTRLHKLGLQLSVGRKDPSGKQENVVRTGIGYEFYLNDDWFIKPYYARDFIDEHDDEDVFGAYIGYGF